MPAGCRYNGELVARYRIAAGLKRAELSERAGLSDKTIQRLEAGTTNPSEESIERIAEVLGLRPVDFIPRSDLLEFVETRLDELTRTRSRPRKRPCAVHLSLQGSTASSILQHLLDLGAVDPDFVVGSDPEIFAVLVL